MDTRTPDSAKPASGKPGTEAIPSVDYESLARNAARFIEEGGKALAAYMKPREEGRIKPDSTEDLADAIKSIGQVTEYWLADPQRALELQTSLGRAYLDLYAGAAKRLTGETVPPAVVPDPKDKRMTMGALEKLVGFGSATASGVLIWGH